jgi:hypothetical protein
MGLFMNKSSYMSIMLALDLIRHRDLEAEKAKHDILLNNI